MATLYDPQLMPDDLREAHVANDRAVMKAYGFNSKMKESDIVTELFKLYQQRVKEIEQKEEEARKKAAELKAVEKERRKKANDRNQFFVTEAQSVCSAVFRTFLKITVH